MNVPAAAHESLMSMVRDQFSVDAGSNGLVVDDLGDAGREVCSRVSWGRDPAEAWIDFEAARAEVIEVFSPLADDSRDLLPGNLRRYIDRAIANLGLESPYRLLNLTVVQRTAMLALQKERDRVLGDARLRVRPERLEAARQAFETEAQLLLTPLQQAELAQFQANIAANLEAVLDRELADYPDDPTGEDTEDAGQAKAVLQWKNSPLAAMVSRLGSRMRAVLETFAPSRVERAESVALQAP